MAICLKLYLLELAGGKYYVGQSDDPHFRFSEHLGKKGSQWTRLHKPLRILMIREISVESLAEAMLRENWLTLQNMERFGWENVRGGDFTIVEAYQLRGKLEYIYDFEQNKIRYYVPDCCYLFGKSDAWHVYVLELMNGRFYIGSSKRLGKCLGEHFNGNSIDWTRDNPVLKVVELVTLKPGEGTASILKNELVMHYISLYGWDNVRGGQMPPRR